MASIWPQRVIPQLDLCMSCLSGVHSDPICLHGSKKVKHVMSCLLKNYPPCPTLRKIKYKLRIMADKDPLTSSILFLLLSHCTQSTLPFLWSLNWIKLFVPSSRSASTNGPSSITQTETDAKFTNSQFPPKAQVVPEIPGPQCFQEIQKPFG